MSFKICDIIPGNIRFVLRELVQEQEIKSDLNQWGAGQEFGHKPNNEEAARHFIFHPKGAKELDLRHPELATR